MTAPRSPAPFPSLFCAAMAIWVLPYMLACGGTSGDGNAKAASRPVLVAWVESASPGQSAYTGVVAARTESDLGFRVGGKIVERRVDPGDRVRAGDTLLVLDVEDFELAAAAPRETASALPRRTCARPATTRRATASSPRPATSRSGPSSWRRPGSSVATADARGRALRRAPDREPARLLDAASPTATASITDVSRRARTGRRGGSDRRAARARRRARSGHRHSGDPARAAPGTAACASAFGDSEHAVRRDTARALGVPRIPSTRTFRARYVLDGDAARFPIGSTVTVRLQGLEHERPRARADRCAARPGTRAGRLADRRSAAACASRRCAS